MYILQNQEKNFSIIWNAKCACTTIKLWYLHTINDELFLKPYHNGEINIDRVHGYVGYNIQPYRGRHPKNLENHTTIMVVRNPYARMVSCYKDKVIRGKGLTLRAPNTKPILGYVYPYDTFEQFIRKFDGHPELNHHTSLYWYKHGAIPPFKDIEIVKTETLQHDMDKLINKLGLEPYEFNKSNQTKQSTAEEKYVGNIKGEDLQNVELPSYKWFYNDETKEIVNRTYKSDLELFNYAF
jgi:hypothetical protein